MCVLPYYVLDVSLMINSWGRNISWVYHYFINWCFDCVSVYSVFKFQHNGMYKIKGKKEWKC